MKKIGLYLHSPFCSSKCGYCDFNSWGEQRIEQMYRWFEALKHQLSFWGSQLKQNGYVVDTIFFGGGTPSLLPTAILEALGSTIRQCFPLQLEEFTVECNPETLSPDVLRTLGALGADRISIGIQSFDDRVLERLERQARRKDNLRALECLAEHWPGRWSMDLIFACPGQDLTAWQSELEQAIQFNPRHLSCYELTLSTERSKNWKKPSEETILFFYNFTEEYLMGRGFERYEISNFAQPGQECRHNLKYWRLEPFLGLGPGASGLLPEDLCESIGQPLFSWGAHQKQPANFERWCALAGDPMFEKSILEPRQKKDQLYESMLMGFRLNQGIEQSVFEQLGVGESMELVLQNFAAQGYFRKMGMAWVPTRRGWLVLDHLLPMLFSQSPL